MSPMYVVGRPDGPDQMVVGTNSQAESVSKNDTNI